MIRKIFSLSDGTILKRSTYYVHLFGLIMGIAVIVGAIGGFIFKRTESYRSLLRYEKGNSEYLQHLADKLHDGKLFNIADVYTINFELIEKLYLDYLWFLLFFGVLLIYNFFLFKKLRDRLSKDQEK